MAKAVAPNAPAVAGAATTTTVAGVEREAPVLATIRTDIPLPTGSKPRGAKSAYNFDDLPVGGSIGIGNKTIKQVKSIVSNYNRAKSNYTEKRDDAGNIVFKMQEIKSQDGVITRVPTQEAETVRVRELSAYEVDATTDPDNVSVRVFRLK